MVQSAKVCACSCGVTGQHLASRRSSDRDHHDFFAAFCAATGAGSRLRATREFSSVCAAAHDGATTAWTTSLHTATEQCLTSERVITF